MTLADISARLLQYAAKISPESSVRQLYCNGLQIQNGTGQGIQSDIIQSQPRLEAMGIPGVNTAYRFFYPLSDRLLLDESGVWQLSFDGGVTLQGCNLRKVTQHVTGQGWEIIVDVARRELSPNLTVAWLLGTGTFTTDVATGNPVEDTTTETAYAVMSVNSAANGVYRLSGYFCTEDGTPQNTPDGWQYGIANDATLTDPQTGLEHQGRFTSVLQAQEPTNPLAADSGSALAGSFVIYGSGDIEP